MQTEDLATELPSSGEEGGTCPDLTSLVTFNEEQRASGQVVDQGAIILVSPTRSPPS